MGALEPTSQPVNSAPKLNPWSPCMLAQLSFQRSEGDTPVQLGYPCSVKSLSPRCQRRITQDPAGPGWEVLLRPPTPLHLRAAQAREDKVVQSNTEMALIPPGPSAPSPKPDPAPIFLDGKSFESSDTNAFALHYPLLDPGAIVIYHCWTGGPGDGNGRYPPFHISQVDETWLLVECRRGHLCLVRGHTYML